MANFIPGSNNVYNMEEWLAENKDRLMAFLETLPQPDWAQLRAFKSLCEEVMDRHNNSSILASTDAALLLAETEKMDNLTLLGMWSLVFRNNLLLIASGLHHSLIFRLITAAKDPKCVLYTCSFDRALDEYIESILPPGASVYADNKLIIQLDIIREFHQVKLGERR